MNSDSKTIPAVAVEYQRLVVKGRQPSIHHATECWPPNHRTHSRRETEERRVATTTIMFPSNHCAIQVWTEHSYQDRHGKKTRERKLSEYFFHWRLTWQCQGHVQHAAFPSWQWHFDTSPSPLRNPSRTTLRVLRILPVLVE
jgi:hypothetical protein